MKNKKLKDCLGERMKDIESRTRYYLPRRTYTICRLDGKSFHTFTKNCEKPFDPYFIQAMQYTTQKLCEQIMGSKIGYTQSDEISLVLTDFDDIGTEAFFDGNIQKICSVSASIATAYFNQKYQELEFERFRRTGNASDHPDKNKVGCFDCRVYTVSDPWEVYNAILWRQNDCVRNSVSCTAQSLYSHKQLLNKNSVRLKEMIAEKGKPWDDYPNTCKYGSFVIKKDSGWMVDENSPMINKNRKYFFDNIPLMEGVQEINVIKESK